MNAADAVSRGIAATVAFAARFPVATAVAILGLVGASLHYAAGNLEINTDTADMISPELPWRRDFNAYRDSFPSRDNNIVVVVDGPDGETSASFARDLAIALEAEPERFRSVFLAGHGEFFEQNGLLYLPLDELEGLAERLIEAQPLLGRLADDVSGAGILAVLGESVGRRAGAPALADDTGIIFSEIALTLAAAADGTSRPIAWGGLIGLDAGETSRQLLLVQPALDFTLVRPARDAIERIREIGAALNGSRGGAVELRLTGTLAMEHEELSSITSSASAAGLAALALVTVVLLWALRSVRLLVIAVVTLLAGLGITAAFAALTVGRLNLLSIAFAVLYIGLGVDFILHFCLRLKELGRDGQSPGAALIETARGVGSSLAICAVTTAVSFFAFIPTDFDGISELGLISGGGMFISLIVSLTLLPALIRLFWRTPGSAYAGLGRKTRSFGWRPPPRSTSAIAAGLVIAALVLLPGLDFDGNPINLRDPTAESIRALEDLAAAGEAPLFNLAVLVPDATAAGTTAAALSALPSVEQARTVASLVPGDQAGKLAVIDDLRFFLGSTLAALRAGEADPGRFAAELERLVAALRGQDSVRPAESELVAAGERWLARWRSLDAASAAAGARALDQDIRGNLVAQVARLESGLEARAFGRDDLPSALRARWSNDAGQELVEVVPAEDMNDSEAVARFVTAVRSVAPNATGLPVVYEEAAATVTRAFVQALGYAFVAVTLMLLLFLRSIGDTVMVLVPIAFAAIVTAGVGVLIGLPLNFANVIALPLLIGVGVDSGIHMVHRMRTEPPSDGDPLHTSTSRAVFASAATTVASFGNLAFSTHLGMASMGQLLTLGMVMSLIAVLILLPALMRLKAAP